MFYVGLSAEDVQLVRNKFNEMQVGSESLSNVIDAHAKGLFVLPRGFTHFGKLSIEWHKIDNKLCVPESSSFASVDLARNETFLYYAAGTHETHGQD